MRRMLVVFLCLAACATACAPSPPRVPAAKPHPPVPVVIWSSRDLPTGLHEKVAAIDGVRWVTRMTVGMVDLVAVGAGSRALPPRARGAVLPLSIAAMEPSPGTRDAATLALNAGNGVLSESEADLRGMTVGSTMTIGAGTVRRTFSVGAIVPDLEGRGRELIIPFNASSGLGLTAPRALISSVEANRVEEAVAQMKALTEGVRARIRTAGQDVGDFTQQVLPFGDVKRIFGEFSYRPTAGRFIVPDPVWESANIVQERVPLLGLIACNGKLLVQLGGAMRELIARGLSGLVRSYDGCYSPRMQVGNAYALSRHAYGIAVDLNAGANPYGATPKQDPRLIEVMERWGFTWGGRWLVPDGMHFEFVRFVTNPNAPAEG
jgi:hypothetical protein